MGHASRHLQQPGHGCVGHPFSHRKGYSTLLRMNPQAANHLVGIALEAIDGISLPHPAAALLRCYVKEALHPPTAAQYVQHRLGIDGNADSLLKDWISILHAGK